MKQFFTILVCLIFCCSCFNEKEIVIHKIVYTHKLNGSIYIEIHKNGTVVYSGAGYGGRTKVYEDYKDVFSFTISKNTFEYYSEELKLNDFLSESFEVTDSEFISKYSTHFMRVHYNDTIKDFVIQDLAFLRMMAEMRGLIKFYEAEETEEQLDNEFIHKVLNTD